ncbi:MAG: hypothetical protein SFW67_23140 [Myxococcaceae bacterium]|nr:hypothetical protein [Myxococcaceae bacterium]
MRSSWPDDAALASILSLPEGVALRAVRHDELGEVPQRLRTWFPTIEVGAESVFLDEGWLERHVATAPGGTPERIDSACGFARAGDDGRDVRIVWVERDGVRVGLMSFERQLASQTLHGRVGALDPEARAGVLGALGFPVFEALGRWLEAELLLVWVTLASRGQQVMAERRGFSLCGLVPGFDRDQLAPGRSVRVMEALYAKVLAPNGELRWPGSHALTPHTRAVLEALRLVRPE